MKTRLFVVLGVVLAGVCMSGCVSSSRSSVTVQESAKFSKGEELNDLLRALNQKALTQQEYEDVRQTIMKRPN
jgi:hypothetical protein